MKVLLITYEFTHAPFSGNGMLSRSLAKSLLSLGASLRVICCRPAPTLLPGAPRPDHVPYVVAHRHAAGNWAQGVLVVKQSPAAKRVPVNGVSSHLRM